MKEKSLIAFLFLTQFLFLFGPGLAAQEKPEKQIFSLNKNWKFRQSLLKKTAIVPDSGLRKAHIKQKPQGGWHPAQVPGTVHTDLLNAHLIPDPYFRNNEKKLEWVSEADWDYQTSFKGDKKLIAHEAISLVFEGLDTYSKVYLNDTLLTSTDNMFLQHEISLKGRIREGNNTLRVHFESALKKAMPAYKDLPYHLPASNDQSDVKLSMFTRKAPYQYGWDWGPRLVTAGIWKPVYLVAWNTARLQNIHYRQRSLSDQKAEMTATIEIEGQTADRSVFLEVSGKRAGLHSSKKLITLKKGIQRVDIPFIILKPKRWWPNGLGNPELYDLHVSLHSDEGKLLDSSSRMIGLRTVEMVNKKDSLGESFYFKVNGVPVFMKGANYIPSDNFVTRVSRARYDGLFNAAVASNMNMLRVWGGGIYESDYFYDEADRRGLLIWQDLMFACSMYPGDSAMVSNIRKEIQFQARRLRDHPSLAMWCGNNEIDIAWHGWGWQKKYGYSPQDSASIYQNYKLIFEHAIPEQLRSADPSRFYLTSSPAWKSDRSKDYSEGDAHSWEVWAGAAPISFYKSHVGRFMSEYGFQSLPSLRTVQAFTIPTDLNLDSSVILGHQRASVGNKRMLEYMEKEYKVPSSFPEMIYVSQIQQGEAVRQAIEAHRRARNYCMGSLYWQLDDCWPAASWSAIDYYGRKKALYYLARRAFSSILLSPVVEKGKINVYVVSDQLREINCDMRVQFQTLEGDKIVDKRFGVLVYPNSSHVYFTTDKNTLLKGLDSSTVVMKLSLSKAGEVIAENTLYFAPTKSLPLEKPEFSYTLQKAGKAYWLTIQSYRLAKGIWLDTKGVECDFSDNYFDLLPGESHTVLVKPKTNVESLDRYLKIKSMNEIGEPD